MHRAAIGIALACAALAVAAWAAPATVRLGDLVEGGQEPEEVVYKRVGAEALKLYIFRPPGRRRAKGRPAAVWIHGGGWSRGRPQDFFPHCRYYASRGAVAVSVGYLKGEPTLVAR